MYIYIYIYTRFPLSVTQCFPLLLLTPCCFLVKSAFDFQQTSPHVRCAVACGVYITEGDCMYRAQGTGLSQAGMRRSRKTVEIVSRSGSNRRERVVHVFNIQTRLFMEPTRQRPEIVQHQLPCSTTKHSLRNTRHYRAGTRL